MWILSLWTGVRKDKGGEGKRWAEKKGEGT